MKHVKLKAVTAAVLGSLSAGAAAGLSGNVGFTTDYVYRGVALGDAGAFAGVDFEAGGFYAGVWAIDDGDNYEGNNGLETDFYLGYGMELEGGFSYGVGLTHYDYTYNSDSESEVTLSLGFQGFGFSYSYGVDDNVGTPSHDSEDLEFNYSYYDISWSNDVYSVLIGQYVTDADQDDIDFIDGFGDYSVRESINNGYTYIELGAAGEVVGLDMAVALGRVFDIKDADGEDAASSSGTEYLSLTVSKSFNF